MGDLMGLQALMGDEELSELFQKYTGIDPKSIDAGTNMTAEMEGLPTLTDDQIQEIIDVVLPKVQANLMTKDADGTGILSPACCMCTKTAMQLVYNLMSTSEPPVTDLNPYMKFVTQVMDKLQCSSLDNMVFYPHPTCPVARRMGLFA